MSDPVDIAQEREQIQRDEAMAKLSCSLDAQPSDGICKGCGDAIDPERLVAIPTARRCIECARVEDKRSKLLAARGRP
ncbi:hypothetical protein ED208_12520 [Stagnimonas aquatica]|uniref:Zinc finger DksA/TraR C4-type domain-containing protein n=1 Tax=Stagnimonas aquatica TaxID=2689987 RepID=A0A3N0V758_9GAMM|nr:TraR/DksA C4-type zinc finger protein [Stagnimonas aquatica]ROH88636.1 hypothetical protein ED208_12520 [Stagnimonas aquatica]